MLTDLRNIAKTVWRMCDASEQRTESRLTRNLGLAKDEIQRMGGIKLGTDKVHWNCMNQFTHQATEVELPRILLGNETWLGQPTDVKTDFPVVDFVKQTTRDFCTIFQRMNEEGDMLRVCTSVLNEDGTPAIGTYIPRRNPDGTENPVIAAVLRGETYRGRAFVVNDWHTTVYEPMKDAHDRIIGMLYVGISQSAVIRDVREALMKTVVGRSGLRLGGGRQRGETRGLYRVQGRPAGWREHLGGARCLGPPVYPVHDRSRPEDERWRIHHRSLSMEEPGGIQSPDEDSRRHLFRTSGLGHRSGHLRGRINGDR